MDDYMFIKQNACHLKIFFSEIQYAETEGKYIRIVTAAKQYIARLSIHHFISKSALHGAHFCRIHKSYIISLQKIISFDNTSVMVAGKKLPIGRHYKNIFFNRIDFFTTKSTQAQNNLPGIEGPIIIDINRKIEKLS